ncbi:hypothetical protein ACL02R_18100 [Streptomyces sp. MS19]|uniref:hypothetical protein n=1 Tax=Streptomyces sp. MS19 TaxID=3385972 RepID=UPI0039A35A19
MRKPNAQHPPAGLTHTGRRPSASDTTRRSGTGTPMARAASHVRLLPVSGAQRPVRTGRAEVAEACQERGGRDHSGGGFDFGDLPDIEFPPNRD